MAESIYNNSNIPNKEVPINDSGYQDTSSNDSLVLIHNNEQETMSNLNNRLAVYIGLNRTRDDQANVNKTLEEISEIPSIQLENLKLIYEYEIDDLREALDNQSIDIAALTIQNNKLLADKENSQITNNDQLIQISKLKETILNLQSENKTLNNELTVLKDNQNSANNLGEQLKTCQEQLENEVLLRTSAENACLTYKEKMQFNDAVFKKELGALMITHKLTLKKLTTYQNNISMRLYEEMEDARNSLRDNLNELHDLIKENLFDTIEKAVNSISVRSMQLSKLRSANDATLEDQHKLLMELDKIKASHVKLENQLSNIQTLNEEEIFRLNAFIDELTNDKLDRLEKRFTDFQDLTNSFCEKTVMGEELAIYRKMLDSEETRTDFQFPTEAKRMKLFRESDDDDEADRKVLKATRRKRVCAIM